MEDLLQGLNTAQREAVTTTEGFVRVIAGAGSGKTRALTHRFAFLVNELGILPGNILCVTFTNKSANEMRQRIHNLTGDRDTGYINTFHGFCVSSCRMDTQKPWNGLHQHVPRLLRVHPAGGQLRGPVSQELPGAGQFGH